MAFRPWRWLVLFFTRPIRLSDVAALARWLKPRPGTEPVAAAAGDDGDGARASAASKAPIVVPRTRPAPLHDPVATWKNTTPTDTPSVFRRDLEIGVSEQPFDTLPAELRDELERPKSGGLQGSLRNA